MSLLEAKWLASGHTASNGRTGSWGVLNIVMSPWNTVFAEGFCSFLTVPGPLFTHFAKRKEASACWAHVMLCSCCSVTKLCLTLWPLVISITWYSQVACSGVKNPPANVGSGRSIPESGRSPGEGTATHSSTLAWEISWTEEPGRLQFIGSQRGKVRILHSN